MRLRPLPTHHFEVFTPRDQTVHALDILARTGTVELDVTPKLNASLEVKKVEEGITEFDDLIRPFRTYLPDQEHRPMVLDEAPDTTARRAIEEISAWVETTESLITNTSRLEAERDNLTLLQECLANMTDAPESLALLSDPDSLFYKGLFACSRDKELDDSLCHVFQELVAGTNHRFLILVGMPEQQPLIEAAVQHGACFPVQIPDWLTPDLEDWRVQVGLRIETIEGELTAYGQQIEELNNRPAVKDAVANIALLRWYTSKAAALTVDEKFCHILGWTTETSPTHLEQVLRERGIHGIARFLDFPDNRTAPVTTLDTWWTRPFQPFIQMYGTPGESEVDPSVLLVLVMPLLFGYMFPDVGHGLVLIAVSTLLYYVWPEGRFLIPCR